VPVRISDHVWVRPSWTDFAPPQGDIVIAIEPGMAFGTGTHATTYLTLRLMEKYIRPGDRVLDIGCGSGILSIAASMFGAGEVIGTDIDPEAVRTANENIALNGVGGKVAAVLGDLVNGLDGYAADLVVANLLTPLVLELSGQVSEYLAPQGVYISSGILDEHLERVTNRLKELGYRILEILSDDGWCAVAATAGA